MKNERIGHPRRAHVGIYIISNWKHIITAIVDFTELDSMKVAKWPY